MRFFATWIIRLFTLDLIGYSTNGLVLYLLFKNRSHPNARSYDLFTITIAFVDLCFITCFETHQLLSYKFNFRIHDLPEVLQYAVWAPYYIFALLPQMLLLCRTYCHYLAICHPFRFRTFVTKRRVSWAIATTTFISTVLAMLKTSHFLEVPTTLMLAYFVVEMLVLLTEFILLIVFTCVCCSAIVRIYRQQKSRKMAMSVKYNNSQRTSALFISSAKPNRHPLATRGTVGVNLVAPPEPEHLTNPPCLPSAPTTTLHIDNGPEQAIAAANDNGVYSSSCIPVDVNVCEHQEIVAIVEDGDNATDSITGSSPIDVCPQGATLVDTIDCESATRVTEESHRVSLGAIEVHNNHAPAVSDAIQNCSGRPEASNTQWKLRKYIRIIVNLIVIQLPFIVIRIPQYIYENIWVFTIASLQWESGGVDLNTLFQHLNLSFYCFNAILAYVTSSQLRKFVREFFKERYQSLRS